MSRKIIYSGIQRIRFIFPYPWSKVKTVIRSKSFSGVSSFDYCCSTFFILYYKIDSRSSENY